MNMLDRSPAGAAAQHASEAPSQWTDNVARVAAVVKANPEVKVEWPYRVNGDFVAEWPGGDARTSSAGELAAALEAAFPPGNDGGRC